LEICTLRTTRKGSQISELLLERGWLVPLSHIRYLIDRKLEKRESAAALLALHSGCPLTD
jgi:hypothetical protein